jgi:RimJ/RimL family protein N-acetyltransferase
VRSFQSLDPDGLRYIELLHQAGNHASCRVAQKSGYALTGVLPAKPPDFPTTGTCIGGIRRVLAPAAAGEPADWKN